MERLEFREIACIALGGLTGALIALPWAGGPGSLPAIPVMLLFSVLGALLGYRKRKSVFFFYLCLICVGGLATLFFSTVTP